ncbi:hypothetical protein OGM63_02730 [Plectonema radiosum NIES-515]|uniref:Uridine phosphorylase n=1 Tax=Plectonema radiosum NIES-515 TaxID=2986073 RepID=A0ABT3ATK7_9CYAN|nr:hypothetical protein [Plectonema radiosum]MCV3212456.1 hypothetical protein [Plectonema radiosum NIES-515]
MAQINSDKRRNLWFERLMAIIATVNLCICLFDLSYIPWRDLYLRKVPQITKVYDKVKGIKPHREIENYLENVKLLEEQVSQTGLKSKESAIQLEELRRLSTEMIDGNPFGAVNKSGTLEKIKNRMRDRTSVKSAKQAFGTFWSQAYLTENGWNQEIAFFNQKIQPLIVTGYYRTIDENGEFTNILWLIDLPFVTFFALELLARTFYIRRQNPGFSWLDAVLWRWYDLFLLLPFWRLLRIIPVLVRLDQAHLLNLQPVRKQINQGVVANFAEELTEIVIVRLINQIQGSIKQGDLTRWLLQKENHSEYVDINNINEVEAIAGILIKAIVYQVLPKIEPEIVAILHHSIDGAFNQSPIYRNLHNLPGVGQIQAQLSEQLSTQIATNLYKALVSAVEDPVATKLSSQLLERFSEALGAEMQKKQVLSEIQSLLFDFLEEVKINYVQRLSHEDIEQIIQQTRQMRSQASHTTVVTKSSALLQTKNKASSE